MQAMNAIRGSGGSVRQEELESEMSLQSEKFYRELNKNQKKSVVNPFQVSDNDLEKVHQKALILWLSVACKCGVDIANNERSYLEEGWAFKQGGVPNEPEKLLGWVYSNNLNQASGIAGVIASSMGARKGMPDLGLDVKVDSYCGLRIEMKRATERNKKLGGLSPKQIEWQQFYVEQKFMYVVCYSWLEARDVIWKYARSC